MVGDTTTLQDGRARPVLRTLTGLYFSPGREFVVLMRRPRFWLPMLGLMVLNVVFTAVWLRQVDPAEFMKTQLEETGRWEQMTPDQREGIFERQAKFLPVIGWAGALLGPPILILIVGSVYLFIFRFFFASDVNFRRSLSVVGHVFLAVSLVTVPLTLLTLALQGDWNVDPRTALQANASLLLDKETTPRPLWSLAESLDLFSFWGLWLLSLGYGIASSRRTSGAAPGVLGPWAIYVVAKAGFAALF